MSLCVSIRIAYVNIAYRLRSQKFRIQRHPRKVAFFANYCEIKPPATDPKKNASICPPGPVSFFAAQWFRTAKNRNWSSLAPPYSLRSRASLKRSAALIRSLARSLNHFLTRGKVNDSCFDVACWRHVLPELASLSAGVRYW